MINPILQRHLWTDFSMHRLLMMPAILGAIFALGTLTVAETPREIWGFLAGAGLTLFGLIVLIAGTWRACRSVPDQKANRTWENIRLSSLSSWQLACGELFGATAYYWYGGLICLLMVIISASVSAVTAKNFGGISVIVFLAAFLTHLTALQLSLSGTGTTEQIRPISFGACFIISFIGPLFIRQMIDWNTAAMMGAVHPSQLPDILPASWYGLAMGNAQAVVMSYALMTVWGLIGLNQAMRRELQMTTPVMTWVAFVVFCLIYFAGFVFDPNSSASLARSSFIGPLNMIMWLFTSSFSSLSFLQKQSGVLLPLAFAFCTSMSLTYFMAFWEPKDITVLRRFRAAVAQKNWRRINSLYPRWLATAQISAVAGVIFLGAAYFTSTLNAFALGVASMLLFMSRDLGLILLLSLRPRSGRRGIAVFVYLFALYVLFPGLVAAVAHKSWLFIFLPGQATSWAAALIPPLAQALLVWFLVRLRWLRSAAVHREGAEPGAAA